MHNCLPKSSIVNLYAVGFSIWKRQHVRAFLQDRSVIFVRKPAGLPKRKQLSVATWGMRIPTSDFPDGTEVLRLEDGFLRSVGLGADLVRPLSWVRDTRGIYYDATKPSDLEYILKTSEFTGELKERAKKLRESLLNAEITKYNVGNIMEWRRPLSGQRVILVPGQVESDASIRYGAGNVKTNLDLLKASRSENPDAFIIYKPHPDVVAGLRSEGKNESAAVHFCDEVVGDISMGSLLKEVDEVHVMTSLTGFEALLRGKKVVAYGMPFYAGWGLTIDRGMRPESAARRTRLLSLDELVAGALILYPTYVSRKNGQFTTPENALHELLEWRDNEKCQGKLWRTFLRRILQAFRY